jgi:predicted RNA binding protein YcfA (HicA-like mRNA interferase family)
MSDKLPVISGRDCVKALQQAGFFIDRQKGSHIILRREDPPPARSVVVPDHKTLDRGTLRGIIRQAGITVDQFVNLLG